MKAIASIVREFPNIVVVSDEVYKFSVYDAKEAGDSTAVGHYHFARLPGTSSKRPLFYVFVSLPRVVNSMYCL